MVALRTSQISRRLESPERRGASLIPAWLRLIVLSLVVMCSSVGCGGYWPLRRPRSDLWTPNPNEPFTIQLPSRGVLAYPAHIEQEGVTVAAELMDPARTKAVFQVDLLRNGVQPLLLLIHNGTNQTYAFRKASVDPRYLPAGKVAQWACVHPVVRLAQFAKWLAFVMPGLVFECVIEPTTTFDFPGIEEAARRPAVANDRAIREEFMKREIADATILPDQHVAGVMFIRPPKLGRVIPLTLINTSTTQPLIVELPTPPPVYKAVHEYVQAYDTVWGVSLRAASRIGSWQVTSSNQTTGVIVVKQGLQFFLARMTPLTLTLQRIDARHTRVTVERPIRQATSARSDEHSRTIDTFFNELDRVLPLTEPPPKRFLPPPQPAGSQPTPRGLAQ